VSLANDRIPLWNALMAWKRLLVIRLAEGLDDETFDRLWDEVSDRHDEYQIM